MPHVYVFTSFECISNCVYFSARLFSPSIIYRLKNAGDTGSVAIDYAMLQLLTTLKYLRIDPRKSLGEHYPAVRI